MLFKLRKYGVWMFSFISYLLFANPRPFRPKFGLLSACTFCGPIANSGVFQVLDWYLQLITCGFTFVMVHDI